MRLTNFLTSGTKRFSLGNKEFWKPCIGVIGRWPADPGKTFLPPVDLFETDDELCVFVDLPGLKFEELELSLKEGILLLKGVRQKEREPDWNFFCKERPYGSFQRTILLPDRELDADAMEAKLEKGVLQVTIPKKDSTEVVPQFLFSGSGNRSCSGNMVFAH